MQRSQYFGWSMMRQNFYFCTTLHFFILAIVYAADATGARMSVVLTLRQKYEVKGRTKKTEPPQRLEEQKSAACCSVHPSSDEISSSFATDL
ncbi:hypothetical protein T11_12505 [Trichinella zimbabwensis]|uniref:Uncharacterized protein n=1 Tax=Trichinella zimbabwensis TaxID=268475 RepID=A0A0V1HHP5_9BILA|nr:hypothetical protein T11_12505 [Trichinella zimbabwensis]